MTLRNMSVKCFRQLCSVPDSFGQLWTVSDSFGGPKPVQNLSETGFFLVSSTRPSETGFGRPKVQPCLMESKISGA